MGNNIYFKINLTTNKMQSSHQQTPTNEVIVGKTIELDGVKYEVDSLLGTGYTAKVYKAQTQASVINDA